VRHGDNLGILGEIPKDLFRSLYPDQKMLDYVRSQHEILIPETDRGIITARAELGGLIEDFRNLE
jgi:hypothetical protein